MTTIFLETPPKPELSIDFGCWISQEVETKIKAWLLDIQPKIIKVQKGSTNSIISKLDIPYYGSTGGGITYSFTPTNIGMILKVKESISGEVLDVTPYDEF